MSNIERSEVTVSIMRRLQQRALRRQSWQRQLCEQNIDLATRQADLVLDFLPPLLKIARQYIEDRSTSNRMQLLGACRIMSYGLELTPSPEMLSIKVEEAADLAGPYTWLTKSADTAREEREEWEARGIEALLPCLI